MLNYCKISQYKIKKILKIFTEDYTAAEASRVLKLNIKTTTRYYTLFKRVTLRLGIMILKSDAAGAKYIGCVRGAYGDKSYFNVYKKDCKTFFCTKLSQKSICTIRAKDDSDFQDYLSFMYKRFRKFYGVSGQGYYYQLFESIVKYRYGCEELFLIIWKYLTRKNKESSVINNLVSNIS